VQNFLDSEKWVDHTNTVIGRLETIISLMKDAETGQRGFLLTGNEKFLEPYNGSERMVKLAFDTVMYLTKDNPAQQREYRGLKEVIDNKYDLIRNTIDVKKSGGSVSQDILLMGKSYMDRSRGVILRMRGREELLLTVRLSKLDIYGTITLTSIPLAFLVSVASAVYFYRRTVRDIEDKLRLQEEVKREALSLVKKISVLKNLSNRIEKGEYGIEISEKDLR